MKQLVLLVLLLPYFVFSQSSESALIGAMLGDTPVEEDLQELCDQVGGRVTGSDANKKAVEWALKKFQAAGLKAYKDPFEMPVLWLPESTTAEISGSVSFHPNIVSKYYSPVGTHRGKLIAVGKGDATGFEAAGSAIRGNFVLVEQDLCLDINGLFAEYAAATKAEMLAQKYGAKGIVFMSSRPRALLYRFITSQPTTNDMPQLVMSREDAARCMRVLQNGDELNISITTKAKTGGAFTTHNVIAEIPGSEKPEEVIVLGAHIDSWALGTGANDNGCNVSMMIDIARQMQRLGIKPKRTIRFALWNGEEQGYFGSWDYTKDHMADMDKHIMALSIDIGSGALTGFFTNGRAELVPVVDEVLKPVAALGDFMQINAPIVGTDNFDFMLQGVGNLVGNHKPQVYGINYHATSDTYDKVDLKQLKLNSAIVAILGLGFANLEDEQITWKQQTRPEIQKMFEAFDLEFTMRMFGVWEPWVSGERGRK
jgi:hypothetical protein